ncbi:MAG: imidazoleglycerol-phosphate dehydratase HisB [Spirochaetota bacterium]|nr:MAG: imidazoleglycerol-phosphate dehydratase HisB [Spirochaetota bacterium]
MKDTRKSEIHRKTKETDIHITFNLDGSAHYKVSTGIAFFDHLLELFAKHGGFNLDVGAKGDVDVDFHHLVEDTGIALGDAFKKAIGKKAGITRFASSHIPMDDALVRVCIDISGRAFLSYNVEIKDPIIVHFNARLVEEFFRAFVHNAEINLHIDSIRGKNAHHIVEACFKAFGVALHKASRISGSSSEIPSTKGVL